MAEEAPFEVKASKSFFYGAYLFVLVSAINLGFALDYYNVAGSIISNQLGNKNPNLVCSFVNDASIIGLIIGSLTAGKLVSHESLGRIGTLRLGCAIIILGCLPQMALSLWGQMFGKLIMGVGVAVNLVSTTIYVGETVHGPQIG